MNSTIIWAHILLKHLYKYVQYGKSLHCSSFKMAARLTLTSCHGGKTNYTMATDLKVNVVSKHDLHSYWQQTVWVTKVTKLDLVTVATRDDAFVSMGVL